MPVVGDHAIESAEGDRLGRKEFAADLANNIRAVDGSQGYVFGLLGPWGSGKTSLCNLVAEELVKDPPFPMVEFNPWMFSGTDVLVDSFLRELSAQLRLKDPARFGKLADQIDRYSQLLTPWSWIPFVGPWASRLKTVAGLAKVMQSAQKESVQEHKARLSNALAALDAPIVVTIDDIDRLDRREVQDIFRLVRLTANFPNVIYLLAFDRGRVEAALDDDGMPGRSYLEKIVQTAWDVPTVSEHLLLQQLGEALDASLEEFGEVERFDEARWPDVLAETIFPLINNMRDVKRYAASVRTTVAALKEQVELVDILALEAVRIFLPDVFAKMAAVRASLTTTSSGFGTQHESPLLKQGIDDLLEASGDRADVVQDVLRRLFPASIRHFDNSRYGSDWLNTWLKGRRVAHADILSLYFERTLPAGLRAFNDAERAIGLLGDPNAFTAFLDGLPTERLSDVVAALEVFEGEYPVDGLPEAIAALLNLLPDLPERDGGMFSWDSRFTVSRVVLRMLDQYKDPERVRHVVQGVLAAVPSLSAKRELIYLVGHLENVGHKLVTEDAAKAFQSAFLSELRAATPTQLAEEHDLGRLLWVPTHFNDEAVLSIPVDAEPEVHLAVLQALTSEIRGQSMGSRAVRRTPTLSWDTLIAVYGGEEAVADVVQAVSGAHLSDSQATLELAQRYLSGWRPPH